MDEQVSIGVEVTQDGTLVGLGNFLGALQFAESYGDYESQGASCLAIQGSTFAFGGVNSGTIDFGGGVSLSAAGVESSQESYLAFGTLQ